MTVTLHAKEILVSVEDGTLNHLIVKNFIARYFSNVMKLSQTVIIFHNEAEISQKKYFFQWLYSAYKKRRSDISPNFLKMLQSSVNFPIKVRIYGSKKIANTNNINIEIEKNNFSLTITPQNPLLISYYRRVFADHLVDRLLLDFVKVSTNKESVNLLSDQLKREKIISQQVVYIYKKLQLENLLKRYENSPNKQHFFKLIIDEDTKLKDAYKTLGCVYKAEKDQVKENYRKLARKFHPDLGYNKDLTTQETMTKNFQKISEAYKLIIAS